MIYSENLIEYLKQNLGDPVKTNSKNIICRCPWCEYNKSKPHYHLYISKTAPIFHCFHSTCGKSGIINRLFEKIEGKDRSNDYVHKDKIKEYKSSSIVNKKVNVKIKIPELNLSQYSNKLMYLKKRFKFANNVASTMNGLVFDIKEFVTINNIQLDEKQIRLLDYFQTNFVGFLSEHKSILLLRNIDSNSTFRHYKIKIFDTNFLDYYKLNGYNKKSNMVVLGEGIFDIYTEHIFDTLNLREKANLYACAFSGGKSYASLLQSLCYHEQIFRFDVSIISDRDVSLDKYKLIKKYHSHIVNKMNIYYNRSGKDFNITPIIPERFVL